MFNRILFLYCGVVFSGAVAAASPESLTMACTECHGAAGVSAAVNTPHLNGQLSDYLEESIGALAQGARITSIPNHVPKTWTRPEISSVAKFYANTKAVRPVQTSNPELAEKGRVIYQKRCAECHPDNGRESDHDAPLMAAQNLEYLMEQARAFVSGKRKFVFQMDDAFRGLSPAELDSVAHFFASQGQYKK